MARREDASSSSGGLTRWDPERYGRFSDHRTRPALELIDRIPIVSPRDIIDLGCGTGAVTRVLAERWPNADVRGVDQSPEMLTTARATDSSVRWEEADVTELTVDAPVDLVFSNAALHWLPDHESLFERLPKWIRSGGCLAVQMPLSFDAPSHRILRETLEGGEHGSPFGSTELRAALSRRPVGSPSSYYAQLERQTTRLDIWETEYLQVLDGEDAVLEWVRGTALRPVSSALPPEEYRRFLELYRRRLRAAYPREANKKTLYPFRRLFIVATI